MLVRRSVLAVLTATATLSALLVAPASAEPEWVPAEVLSDRVWGEPVLATNRSGDQFANWTGSGTWRGANYGAFRSAGGDWGPEIVTPARGEGAAATLDDWGGVTLAWSDEGECQAGDQPDLPPYADPTQDYRLHVSYRPRRGQWHTTKLPGGWDGCRREVPSMAVDRAGTVTVAWQGSGEKLFVVQRPRGGAWTKPRVLAERDRSRRAGPVVGGADGTVTVSWNDAAGVWVSSSSVSGRWSRPKKLFGSTCTGDVASDARGNLTVAALCDASAEDSEHVTLQVASRPARGSWSPARTVQSRTLPPGWGAYSPDVAAAGNSSTVVWVEGEESASLRHAVLSSSRLADGSWSPAEQHASSPDDFALRASFYDASVAIVRGEAVIVWSRSTSDDLYLEATRREGGVWMDSVVLASRLGSGRRSMRQVIAGHGGRFTVLFNSVGDLGFADLVDDDVQPQARVAVAKHGAVLGRRAPIRWAGSDDLAGVRDLDVRVRSAGRNGRFSSWAMWREDTTATSGRLGVRPGRTYCVSARATDRAGNTGRWSRQRCVAAPVDDRALRASAGWQRARSKAAYQRTLTVTSRRGARLVLGGVRAKRLSLVAATCPACGTVEVRHGGRLVGKVDLSSRKARHKRVFTLPGYRGLRSDKVVVRVTSTGKPVRIDGIATSAG